MRLKVTDSHDETVEMVWRLRGLLDPALLAAARLARGALVAVRGARALVAARPARGGVRPDVSHPGGAAADPFAERVPSTRRLHGGAAAMVRFDRRDGAVARKEAA